MNIDTKPPAEKPVLAWDGKQWVRAMWVPKHTKEQNGDGDWADYNEADDTYYWPEGWYELQTHGGDEMLWHLTDGAEVWQELPTAPGAERQSVPAGWKLVPIEPSDEMIDATYAGQHCSDIWRDMIAAAPQPHQKKCWCAACEMAKNVIQTRMALCPECGDKRCPKAMRHDAACSASPQPQPVQQEPVAWLVTGPFEKRSFDMQSFAESWCKGLNKGFGEDVYKISNLVVQSSEPHEKCNDERMCAACYSGQGKCKTQPVQQEPCPECDGTGTVAGSQAHFPCPLCTSPQAQPQPVQPEGPMAETVEQAARDVAKCLNERDGQGLDLRHVAMLVHYAQQPVQQCKWPTCQSEKYQQDLEDQIIRELVGEQPVQEVEHCLWARNGNSRCPVPQEAQPLTVAGGAVFQDAEGKRPVTAIGQPVGRWEPTPLYPPGGAGLFFEKPQAQPLSDEQKQEIHNETGAGHALISIVESYITKGTT